YNRCTFIHVVEAALPVPYLGMRPKPDATVRFPDGYETPADCSVHNPTMKYDFNRVAGLLESANLVKQAACGNALLRGFRAAPVFECLLEQLRQDPMYLVMRGKPVEIPVTA
ncbi:AAC(3) family N-acetyltransferase, partial [Planctomycetota bacterium]